MLIGRPIAPGARLLYLVRELYGQVPCVKQIDQTTNPLSFLLCFFAYRKQKEIPIPGSDLVAFFFANTRFGSLIALPFQKAL